MDIQNLQEDVYGTPVLVRRKLLVEEGQRVVHWPFEGEVHSVLEAMEVVHFANVAEVESTRVGVVAHELVLLVARILQRLLRAARLGDIVMSAVVLLVQAQPHPIPFFEPAKAMQAGFSL